jgi:Intracellular septation protein A
MKQLLDFLPILLFFGAYKLSGIYVATGVIMAATLVQMAVLYKMDGHLQTMHKVTLALARSRWLSTTSGLSKSSPQCSTLSWPLRWALACGCLKRTS